MEHTVQPLGQIDPRRHSIRDLRVANLLFRTDDALGDGRGGGKKRARDFFCGQAADFTERERDPRVWRKGRMAAGEDEPEAVVLEVLFLGNGGLGGRPIEMIGQLGQRRVEPGPPAKSIDCLEAPG
jgi:hypothetical protein